MCVLFLLSLFLSLPFSSPPSFTSSLSLSLPLCHASPPRMLNLLLAGPWLSISETSQVMTINISLPSGDTGNTRSIHKASDQFGSASCHKVVCFFVYFLVLKHQALTLFCIYIPFLVNGDICCEFQYGYVILVFLFLFVITMNQGSLSKGVPFVLFWPVYMFIQLNVHPFIMLSCPDPCFVLFSWYCDNFWKLATGFVSSF